MTDLNSTIALAHGAEIADAAQSLADRDRDMLSQMLFMAAIVDGEDRAARIGMVAMAMQIIQDDAAALWSAAHDLRDAEDIAATLARRAALETLREAIRIRYVGQEG